MRCVDAHQHFWQLARGDYGWLTPALPALYRDFGPADLAQASDGMGVVGTVLVQAAATEAETRYLLHLARAHPVIAGVVGWVDFEAPDVEQRIRALLTAGGGRLKGLRPMVQDLADARWLTRRAIDPAFEAMEKHGLVFDALVRPVHLPALRTRLAQHPGLHAVLDHCGKPDIAGGRFDEWAGEVEALAGHAPLNCKLSGLLTEAAADAGAHELHPYVRHVLRCFGPERVLWGSDWPVLTLRASYRRWFDLSRELVSRECPGREASIFGDNAVRLYGLWQPHS